MLLAACESDFSCSIMTILFWRHFDRKSSSPSTSLLGAVNSAPDFTDQHLVINGASQLFWDLYDGELHARSALGFASLPVGFAVEIEAIFEVIE